MSERLSKADDAYYYGDLAESGKEQIAQRTAEPEQAATPSDEFQRRAEKFYFERANAWREFLDISAEAGYTIEDSLANRSLFMGGYESGKERMNQRTAELEKRDRTCPHCGDQCDLIGH